MDLWQQLQLYLSWPRPRPSAPLPPPRSGPSLGTLQSGDAAPRTARPIRPPGTAPHPSAGSPQTRAPPPRLPASARPRPRAAPPSSRSAATTSGRPMRGGRILGSGRTGFEEGVNENLFSFFKLKGEQMISLYLESVWPSQSEPAALCSGGRRGSTGCAGCCHWSNCPRGLSGGRALSAAVVISPCFLSRRETVKKGESWEVLEGLRREEEGKPTAGDGR